MMIPLATMFVIDMELLIKSMLILGGILLVIGLPILFILVSVQLWRKHNGKI